MTNTTNAAKRVTKAMRFVDIKAILTGATPVNGTSINEALQFIDNELALLAKKNQSNGEKKPTSKQLENEKIKNKILDYLMTQSEPKFCTDICKGSMELADYSTQKIAALVKQLEEEKKITRTIGKNKRAMFSIA